MTLLLFLACSQPVHMQYDFGRANWEALRIQADLSRPSVAESMYPLSGIEATQLRANVQEAATDTESGEAEAIE